MLGIGREEMILPAAGGVAMSLSSETFSVHATTVAFAALSNALPKHYSPKRVVSISSAFFSLSSIA
jgi:hypothetical protein